MAATMMALAGCDSLWSEAEGPASIEATPQMLDSKTVQFKISRLTPPFNGTVKLDLPGLGEITARLTRFEEINDDEFIWRGKIKGDPGGTVTLSVVNGRLVGDVITSEGRIFSIRNVAENTAIVEELDATKIPLEETSGRVEAHLYAGRVRRLEVNPALIQDTAPVESPPETGAPAPEQIQPEQASKAIENISLLVLYTAAAANFQIESDSMKAKINQAISDTNDSFSKSQIDQDVHLAHHERTTYSEQTSIDLDWQALMDRSSHPPLANVDGLIATHQADIVLLLTKPALDKQSCGMGSQMHVVRKSFCGSAVAVVPITCATTKYSFAHELGHIMGADHNTEGGTFSPPFIHSRGYVNPIGRWHTIMSYPTGPCVLPNCQRILYWSNPSVNVVENDQTAQGEPARGSTAEPAGSTAADNAKSLNATKSTVAAFSDECAANLDADDRS
jgi:hypothetical protein